MLLHVSVVSIIDAVNNTASITDSNLSMIHTGNNTASIICR